MGDADKERVGTEVMSEKHECKTEVIFEGLVRPQHGQASSMIPREQEVGVAAYRVSIMPRG